ncbi:MAG: PIN domain-containing protein [Myxococcales bacterium]|nr:PIN domain-containing protein [Myxococcales bacterium]
MAADDYVIDSVVIIDHLNGHGRATAFLGATAGRAHITAVTMAEVLAGYDPGPSRDSVEKLLQRFPLIVVDGDVANLAATLRRSNRWKLPDALQAAAAVSRGHRLVTRNTKDFPPSAYNWVHVPYEL